MLQLSCRKWEKEKEKTVQDGACQWGNLDIRAGGKAAKMLKMLNSPMDPRALEHPAETVAPDREEIFARASRHPAHPQSGLLPET